MKSCNEGEKNIIYCHILKAYDNLFTAHLNLEIVKEINKGFVH